MAALRVGLAALALAALPCGNARAQAGTCQSHRTRNELIGAAIGVAWMGGSVLFRDDTHRIEPNERMFYLGLASWAGVIGATAGSLYENRRCPDWMRSDQPVHPTNCAVALTRGTVSGTVVGGTAGVLAASLVSLPVLPALVLNGKADRVGQAIAIVATSGAAVGGWVGAGRQYRDHCAR
jgi:hypothetical protein